MAHSLTWRILSPEDTHRCLIAPDVPAIRSVLKMIDESSEGKLIGVSKYNDGQVMILLDMFAHLILFTKSRLMSAEKVSALVGILLTVHTESMMKKYTRAQSYHRMRDLMVQHSVPRPPFSCGVFNVRDVQEIDEYVLRSYYRHYKMYVYAFVPREVANLHCVDVTHVHQIPPATLPSLVTATEEHEWRAKVEEQQREVEAQQMQMAEEDSDAWEQERLRMLLLNDPHFSDGIREQLEVIKKEVSGKALDRLDEIEARLVEIEKKISESSQRAESRQGKRKK